MKHSKLLPRFIRLRDAPAYLGMDKHRFNNEVRPRLTEIPIGIQGIAFDRLDLDAWAEHYKHCSGRPAASKNRSLEIWDENERQVSSSGENIGKLTKRSLNAEFAKALALASSKKPRSI